MTRVLLVSDLSTDGLHDSYARGFAAIGGDVVSFPLSRGHGVRGLRRLRARLVARRANRDLVPFALGARPDVVLVLKGKELRGETVARLRGALGVPVCNFYPDDPFSVSRSNAPDDGPEVLTAYDRCFSFARHLLPRYEAMGAAADYLPFARDPALHAPLAPRVAPDLDLVFVGNLDERRVAMLEPLSPFRIGIFGERVRQAVPTASPLARAALFGPAAYGRALAATLGRGRISINVMREQNRGSHNMRSFESPACGAFTLSERTPELAELFAADRELAYFDGAADVADRAAAWLARREERDAIARAGFGRVEHDTYACRARVVLRAVGLPAPEER